MQKLTRLERMKKRLLLFIFLSVAVLFTLSANITIDYFPAQQFYFQAGTGALANSLVGHIGTIVFTNNYANTTTNPINNPTMIRLDMDYSFYFNGPVNWGGSTYSNSDSEFYLIAHAIADNKATVMRLDNAHSYGDPTPLVNSNFSYTGQVLTIDLYIMSHHPLSYYKIDEAYTLKSGIFGTFRLGVTNSTGWYSGTNAVPLPVGNNPSPNTPIPFFDNPSVNPENNPPIYGDPIELITYTFSLLNPNFVPFNLSQATGASTRLKINEAQMSLSGTKANSTHSVKIKFKDDSNAQSFQLLPLSAGPAPINYNMYFGTTQITKSAEINWSGLKENSNPNTKDLTIGGINTNSVNSAASGDYKSTISIEIIYPD